MFGFRNFIIFWIIYLGLVNLAHCQDLAIVKTKDVEPYNACIRGLIEELRERGYPDTKIKIRYYDMEGGDRKYEEIINELRRNPPDLIVTVGLYATKIVPKQLPDIPTIFSMVLNPVGHKITWDIERERTIRTGISLDIPIEEQFIMAKKVIPNLRKIGVLYDPRFNSPMVQKADELAKKYNLLLVSRQVVTEKEVSKRLKQLMKEKINLLWLIPDKTVINGKTIEYLIEEPTFKGVPIYGLSIPYVQMGALFSLYYDYGDVGKQTGKLVLDFLGGKRKFKTFYIPSKANLGINLKVAKAIGLEVPEHILKSASKVIR